MWLGTFDLIEIRPLLSLIVKNKIKRNLDSSRAHHGKHAQERPHIGL